MAYKDPTRDKLNKSQIKAITDATIYMLLETMIEDHGGSVINMIYGMYGNLTDHNIISLRDELEKVLEKGRKAKLKLSGELKIPRQT